MRTKIQNLVGCIFRTNINQLGLLMANTDFMASPTYRPTFLIRYFLWLHSNAWTLKRRQSCSLQLITNSAAFLYPYALIPKIGRVYNAEVVGDRIAEDRP